MSREVGRPLEEPSLEDPGGGRDFKPRQDGAQDPRRFKQGQRPVEMKKPARIGELVIVDESEEIAVRVRYGLVPGHGDVLLRLDETMNGETRLFHLGFPAWAAGWGGTYSP